MESTTIINACNAKIYVDDDTGTPREISHTSNSITTNRSKNTAEYSTFGDEWLRRLQCKKDGSFDLVAVYSTGANEAMDILDPWFDSGGRRTLIVDVPNSNPGSTRYIAEVMLNELGIPLTSDEAGPVMVTANLLPDGAIRRLTIGS